MVEFLKAKTSTYVNKPMGVIDVRTGGVEVGQAIARLGNDFQNMMYADAVDEQKKVGADYVSSLSTRDDEGNLVYEKLPDNMSKVATSIASSQLQKRYANELQVDTSNKMMDLHKLHKDDPEKFDEASRSYINATADELKKNGFGEYSGDFITNSTALMTQHSNKLKLTQFNKQEEKANQTARILVDEGIASSYQLRLNGKIEEADDIDLVNVDNLNNLINEDAINSPAYKELISQIKVNKKQSTLELSIRTMGNNGFAMAALSRAMTTGKITSQDAGLLNAYKIDQAYIDNAREDLSLTEKTKINSWLATTKGKFATAGVGAKALAKRKQVEYAFNNKQLHFQITGAAKILDEILGLTPNVLANMNQNEITSVISKVNGNSVLPESMMLLVNEPGVAQRIMNNHIENGNLEAAKKVGLNVLNLALSVGNTKGINEKQLRKLTLINDRVTLGTMTVVEAYAATYKTERENVNLKEVRLDAISGFNSSFKREDRGAETAYIKSQLKLIFPDHSIQTRNSLIVGYRDLLEEKDITPGEIKKTLESIVKKLYVEHPYNYDLFRRSTGDGVKGGFGTYYSGNRAEPAEKYAQSYLESQQIEIKGEPAVLGENVFLLSHPTNSTDQNGQGSFTLVDVDGNPQRDDYNIIMELRTDEINEHLEEIQANKIQENKAEASIDQATSLFKWENWLAFIRKELKPNLQPPSEVKEVANDQEFMTEEQKIKLESDTLYRSNSAVEDVTPPLSQTLLGSSVVGFVKDTMNKAYENDRIIRDKFNQGVASVINAIKKEGADILRTSPEFIEMTRMLSSESIDGLIDSFERPSNANKYAIEDLEVDEDFNPYQYKDGKGFSIGYGFLISSLEPDELALIPDINKITRPQADAVLQLKVAKIAVKFRRDVPNFDTLSARRQSGLINFAYQLGYENVTAQGPDADKNWPKFFNALKKATEAPFDSEERAKAFIEVGNNMAYNFGSSGRFYTSWHNQTPGRAKRVINRVRGY